MNRVSHLIGEANKLYTNRSTSRQYIL